MQFVIPMTLEGFVQIFSPIVSSLHGSIKSLLQFPDTVASLFLKSLWLFYEDVISVVTIKKSGHKINLPKTKSPGCHYGINKANRFQLSNGDISFFIVFTYHLGKSLYYSLSLPFF